MTTETISKKKKRNIQEPKDFRLFLQGVLAQKCNVNPRYSLRAFAQMLEVDHSSLSQILRGTRPITQRMIKRLGLKLGLNPSQISRYLLKEGGQNKTVEHGSQGIKGSNTPLRKQCTSTTPGMPMSSSSRISFD